MAFAPARPCAGRPTCRNRVVPPQKRCADCSTWRDQQRTNVDLRRLYATVRWFRLRDSVLADEPFCPDCQEREGRQFEPTTDVHHDPKPQTVDEFFDRSRLRALCHPCHSRRTQRGE